MENTRNRLGPYYFDAQYLQDPSPLGGGLVKEEWFRRYLPTEKPSRFEQIVQSWDTAAKPSELSNYSVCTTWGIFERRIYLLDVYRQRLGYPGLKQTVKQLRAAFEATVILIEDKSSGTALIQELVAEGIHGIQPYKPEGDKIMRMSAQTGTIQSGMVYIPLSAAWLRDYLAEATTFPAHRFSDQVDSTSQALDWIKRNLNNGAEAILTWAKGLAMRRYAHVEPKLVRVMAPPDMQGTEFYVGKSRRSLDSDRKSLVTAEEAEQLLKNGWMRIQ